jgi:tetratricopeptide (TPR) repeat protein
VTAPGRGYRFTGEIRRERSAPPLTDPPLETLRPRTLAKFVRWKHAWLLAGILIVACLVLWVRDTAAPRLTPERSTVLLGAIENLTGDPVFDSVPESVLEIGLSQSPFLRLISHRQISDTLKLMEEPPDKRLSVELAREVCLRNDGAAVLGGSIAAFGSHYILILQAADCNSGERVFQRKVEVARKEEVPQALDGLTSVLRTQLGESLPSVRKLGVPIEQVTTRSFDALHAYSVAEQMKQRGDNNAAIPLFVHAIELDPSFALAYAELAAAHMTLREPELGRRNYIKAFESRAHASEKERLWICAEYFKLVGDVTEAIDNYRAMAQLYPKDGRPLESLADLYTRLARYDDAVAAAREGLRLNPDESRAYSILARAYKRSNRFAEAKQVAQLAIAKNLDGWELRCLLYEVAFALGDEQGMADWVSRERGKPNEGWMVEYQAWAAGTAGQIRLARERFEHAIVLISAAGGGDRRATISDFYTDLVQMLAKVGLQAEAREVLTHVPDLDLNEEAPYVLALTGDYQRAAALDQDFGRRYPDSSLTNRFTRPRAQAAIALGQHRPAEAIAILEPVRPSKLRTLDIPSLLGRAYLEVGQPDRAAAEFSDILAHRGVDATDPWYPLAYVGLARALRMQGQIEASRNAYEQFFKFWAQADPDTPELIRARLEYAALSASARP